MNEGLFYSGLWFDLNFLYEVLKRMPRSNN